METVEPLRPQSARLAAVDLLHPVRAVVGLLLPFPVPRILWGLSSVEASRRGSCH